MEHLEELRWNMIRSIVAIAIGSVVAFFLKSFIFDVVLFGPKKPEFITYKVLCALSKTIGMDDAICVDSMSFIIQNRTMAGQFSSHIWASVIVGIILAFPYILWEIWRFMKPGLTKTEIKYSRYGIFFSSFLFFLGVCFGYFLIAPLSIQFFGTYKVSDSIINEIDLTSYVSTIVIATIASGIIFQLPVVVYVLTKIGLITPVFMKTYRRHALVLILLLSAIITPPDVSSQILIAVPLFLLYEASIRISKIVYKES